MKRTPKTQAETRRANRGNVPGVLGMAELAMLMGTRAVGQCPACGRQTWEHYLLGRRCNLMQDDHKPCGGVVEALP